MANLSYDEIIWLYKVAKNPDEEIFILGELTCSDVETIIEVLKDAGVYVERKIQKCIKCKQMYIENGRAVICQSCKRKKMYERRKNKV